MKNFLLSLLERIVYSSMYTLSVILSIINSILMLPFVIIGFFIDYWNFHDFVIELSDYDFGFIENWGYRASEWLRNKMDE